MFFLAGPCGGGGGRGPGRGVAGRGADWLVTELGQSANASQSGESMGEGPPCCDFSGGFYVGVL